MSKIRIEYIDWAVKHFNEPLIEIGLRMYHSYETLKLLTYPERIESLLKKMHKDYNEVVDRYLELFEDLEALNEEKIVFVSFNLDNEEGKEMAEKLNISGQTLLVVKDDKQVNLTNDGFLYARTKPEILREAIQEAVGKI